MGRMNSEKKQGCDLAAEKVGGAHAPLESVFARALRTSLNLRMPASSRLSIDDYSRLRKFFQFFKRVSKNEGSR